MKSKFSAKFVGLSALAVGIIATIIGLFTKVRMVELIGLLITITAAITLVARTEKHDLFKIVGITIILAVILTWIVPAGYFTGATYTEQGMARAGLSDLFLSEFFSVSYFLYTYLFLLVLGGFYAVLSKTGGYQAFVDKLTKFMKGKEIVCVLVISFLMAVFASLSTSVWTCMVFVPLIFTVILKLGLGKIVAFVTTFGSMLVGLVGTTFADNGVSYINKLMSMTYSDVFWTRLGIFALAFILFSFFTVLEVKKNLKKKKSTEDAEDMFLVEPVKKSSKKVWPLVVVLAFVLVFTVLGYIDWKGAFNINVFENFHNNHLLTFKIGNHAIISYILGSSAEAFGAWDLSVITGILIVASFIISKIYHVKFNEYIEAFGEGLKKMARPILFITLAYIVFIISYSSAAVTTIANWLFSLSNTFNPFIASIVTAISSLFHPDFGYTAFTFGNYYISAFPDSANIVATIIPAVHGFMQFIVPSSVVLIGGLAYANISYKSWFKYIWKFLVGLLVCLIAVFALITYM